MLWGSFCPAQSRGAQTEVGTLTSCLWLPFRAGRGAEGCKEATGFGKQKKGSWDGMGVSLLEPPFPTGLPAAERLSHVRLHHKVKELQPHDGARGR